MATEVVSVTVPAGLTAGMTVQITTPSGQVVNVTIPDGVAAGEVFQASVPKAPMAAAPVVVVQATPVAVPVAAQPVVVGDLEIANEPIPVAPVSKCHCCSIALAGVGIALLVLFFLLALVYVFTDATIIVALIAFIILLAGLVLTTIGGVCICKEANKYRAARKSIGRPHCIKTGTTLLVIMNIDGIAIGAVLLFFALFFWYWALSVIVLGIMSVVAFNCDATIARKN